jgi:5S rRNA maturation endonuclease (ribonuclease M5)
MNERGLSFKETLKFIRGNNDYIANTPYVPIEEKDTKFESKYFNKEKNKYNFLSLPIDPDKFFYTKERGFTIEFCKTFGIEHVLSFPYSDYYCIPIIDTEREIYTFEFRKLMEYEYLKKRYESDIPFNRLKTIFKNECDTNNLILDNYKVWKDVVELSDSNLLYLLETKVKYEKNSTLKMTLWNIDNLKFNETLYLVEGIGSISKIWSHISKNVTCTFGSKLTKEQLDILKLFKKIIVIPDNDEAGRQIVKCMSGDLRNILFVIDINKEDTDIDYISEIRSSICIPCIEFIGKNSLTFLTNK